MDRARREEGSNTLRALERTLQVDLQQVHRITRSVKWGRDDDNNTALPHADFQPHKQYLWAPNSTSLFGSISLKHAVSSVCYCLQYGVLWISIIDVGPLGQVEHLNAWHLPEKKFTMFSLSVSQQLLNLDPVFHVEFSHNLKSKPLIHIKKRAMAMLLSHQKDQKALKLK